MTVDRFHPGEYVRDELAARGWSIKTLADRTGLSRGRLEEIIAGKRNLTRLDCLCLGRAFGVDAETWRNLQAAFSKEGGGDEPRTHR